MLHISQSALTKFMGSPCFHRLPLILERRYTLVFYKPKYEETSLEISHTYAKVRELIILDDCQLRNIISSQRGY